MSGRKKLLCSIVQEDGTLSKAAQVRFVPEENGYYTAKYQRTVAGLDKQRRQVELAPTMFDDFRAMLLALAAFISPDKDVEFTICGPSDQDVEEYTVTYTLGKSEYRREVV